MDDLKRTLAPFAYEGVEFPGEDPSTTSGHDSARHQGFGTRGADIESTGRKAIGVRVKAVLVNGLRGWRGDPLYPDVYQRLLRALETTPIGLLSHPTRGVFTVHVDDIAEEIRAPQRRGVYLSLAFTEQGGAAGLPDLLRQPQGDPATTARAAAAVVDTTTPTGAAPKPSLLASLDAALGYLEAQSRTAAEAVTALDALLVDIRARLDDPAAAVVEAHPYRGALGAVRSAMLSYRARYTEASRRTLIVPETMSLARVASMPEAYGDPRRAADLLRANVIPDPSRIPAGTALVLVD